MIIYEWDLETFDEDGDIVDHSFADKLTGHKLSDIDEHTRLVLVRDTCDKVGSVELREWAYAYQHEGKWVLPGRFQDALDADGAVVPGKFHLEIERWQK
jgi:hypothetical protein